MDLTNTITVDLLPLSFFLDVLEHVINYTVMFTMEKSLEVFSLHLTEQVDTINAFFTKSTKLENSGTTKNTT